MTSANFLNIADPRYDGNPTCHVCGAVMVKRVVCDELPNLVHEPSVRQYAPFEPCKNQKFVDYKCLSCGTTTECT